MNAMSFDQLNNNLAKGDWDMLMDGWSTGPAVGFQAGVFDVGNHDEICENAISGAGYASLGATHALPHPPAPAFVRPVDIVTGPAIDPLTFGNTFDGRPYHPA